MPASPPTASTRSANAAKLEQHAAPADIRGAVTPRLYTAPLVTGPPGPCGCGCALTEDTSYGYDLVDFADAIGWPLDPWQRWVAIHMGELLPDWRPRFRIVLIIVARQNGKSLLAKVLTLYWMFIDRVPLIVGTHSDRKEAWKSWKATIDMATAVDALRAELPPRYRRDTLGQEDFWTAADSHYTFAAPNRRAGRGATVHRAILDELREHDTFDTRDAVVGAMTAVNDAQLVAITNQGDRRAVVLRSYRDQALSYIATGEGNATLGLIEYSAPEGSDPTDRHALALANPELGHRINPDVLLAQGAAAKTAEDPEELPRFLTEHMCINVDLRKPGLDTTAWDGCSTTALGITPTDLARHRDRLALCLDVALDGSHATLAAAAVLADGHVHVEMIAAWSSTKTLRAELPAHVERLRPRVLGWFPTGPAAAVVAALNRRVRGQSGTPAWPPRRVTLEPINSELTAVCMGYDEQVMTGDLIHPDDPLLNNHVGNATRQHRGDGWVFARRGVGPVDALYASAGAVHLARLLPPPPPPLKIV